MVQELSFLRSQLSPHFLLNTMNNLYGLSVIKSDDLPRLLLRFSDLLRYSIYDTKSEYVTVRSEMKYLNDFIELQKMRLSDKVNLNIQIPEVICNSGIVPMVLVVFVENAFKHSQDYQDSSKRFINIKIWIEDDFLHFTSENNCGEPSSLNRELGKELETFKIKNEGIGIDTTFRRLELLYGKENLPLIEKINGVYKVSLKLKVVEINE
jgi:sensor histidine kinase YesM